MKNFLFWVLAIVITLAAVVFQRKTGPTNPKSISFEFDSVLCDTKLPRSLEIQSNTSDLELEIDGITKEVNVSLYYKRYPSNESFTEVKAVQSDDLFKFTLPSQPPAGKIAYYVHIYDEVSSIDLFKDSPVILRFKNGVPAGVLIPHILFMFLAMLFANYTGILAFSKSTKVRRYIWLTFIFLVLGGLVLGPVVQKFAFGHYWTGWPFGSDLTDNKTLTLVLFWVAALLLTRKKPRKYLIIIAAILTLAVYSIPHSTLGSEYNYSKNEINR